MVFDELSSKDLSKIYEKYGEYDTITKYIRLKIYLLSKKRHLETNTFEEGK